MFSINHLPRRARRAGISTLLASCTAVSLLSGMVSSASAQSAPSLSIDNVSVTEGVDAAAVFTVTLTGNNPNGITVDWETRDGNGTSPATAGTDYKARNGTLTIVAGTNSNTISVPIFDDATYEPDETFNVKLLSSSVNIADSVGTATIISDDPVPQVRIRDAQASEDAGFIVFNVDMDRAANVDVPVSFDTCDTKCGATATYSEDYKATHGSVTFAANTNDTQQIEVALIDDKVYEGDEQLVVQLTSAPNAHIARKTATGTIDDDEVKPVLAMMTDTIETKEGSSGDWVENVDVGLSGLTDQDVTFSYSTHDGSTPAAHTPGDYNGTSGTGTIHAGTLETHIPVTIHGDKTAEKNEQFIVEIGSQSSNARIGGTITTVILDDDD
jgi:hypothetical protein